MKIAVLYAFIGALWIHLSDRVLATLVKDPDMISRLQTYKGWFYVLVTAVVLYLLIRHYTNSIQSQFNEIQTIFDSLNAVVYVADLETQELLYLNRLGEQQFGEWKGKRCHDVLQQSQMEKCPFCTNDRLVVDGVLQPPHIWEVQNTINHRWYQCIDKAIRWPEGQLVRLEVAIDITETKELERIKRELLSAVGHELRTPLTAVLGFAEYLVEYDPPTEERRSYLQILLDESQRLNRLIDNVLRLNRLKARRESYLMVPLRPEELINSLVEKFSSGATQNRLQVHIAEDLPILLGDLDGLLLVLENLVSNALKFSPQEETVEIGARFENEEVLFWIKDRGVGIPAEELDRIFSDFYRIDNSDQRQTGGAGLGLTLAREIILLHQGRIWTESSA
ncbi:MAG: ATP-binding protein, partial [Desulfuromonadaceae bacterium]